MRGGYSVTDAADLEHDALGLAVVALPLQRLRFLDGVLHIEIDRHIETEHKEGRMEQGGESASARSSVRHRPCSVRVGTCQTRMMRSGLTVPM